MSRDDGEDQAARDAEQPTQVASQPENSTGQSELSKPAQPNAQPEQDGVEGADDSTGITEVGGPIDANNVGYKMLLGLGWKSGRGLGSKGQGKLEPLLTQGDPGGEKGAGLRHVSEVHTMSEKIDPSKLESWEIEEKTADFFKGCYSSFWHAAGTLEEQGGPRNKAPAATVPQSAFDTYKDAWDDKQVSELRRPSSVGHREEAEDDTWEDTWADGVNNDLSKLTVHAEHFFACCKVSGPLVHLLAVEETGEVFRYKVWAESSRDLRKVMEGRMKSGLRVMRPVYRGDGPGMHAIFAVVRSVTGTDEGGLNKEASRIAQCTLYGQVYLICRVRTAVINYSLPQYLQDFPNP